MPSAHPAYILEASWEVCNKVGGIHTVITSKLASLLAEYGDDHYLAVGPYLGGAMPEFSPIAELPVHLKGVAAQLEQGGVQLHYGSWVTAQHRVNAVLLDWSGLIAGANEIKQAFWNRFQLDTLGTDFYDFDQPLLWGVAVGRFAEAFATNQGGTVILQAHEWLSSGALLQVNLGSPRTNLRTVFTTHATVLGRCLASRGSLVSKDTVPDPLELARQYGVTAKHQLEYQGAQLADRFTTVSNITRDEAEIVLGIAAHAVTENGLNTAELPSMDRLALRRAETRQRIDAFLAAYFFPSYTFDLAKTQLQFTMGRYEVHNKGYDLYLRSLGQLNDQLVEQGSDQTVVSFFLVPAGGVTRIRPAVQGQLSIYDRFNQFAQELPQLAPVLFSLWAQPDRPIQPYNIADDLHQRQELEQLLVRLLRPTEPFVSPFEFEDEASEAILSLSRQYGLTNKESDRVKLIYLPIYLDGLDGIFNLSLYDLVAGFDLGVFPSFYEPWGYTPMESLAMGVPAITSNLAGFGAAVAGSKTVNQGVEVLDRTLPESDAMLALTRMLSAHLALAPQEQSAARYAAYQAVQRFDWRNLAKNYTALYRALA